MLGQLIDPSTLLRKFYPWQCLSFVKRGGETTDLAVLDENDLMALIHVVYAHINDFTADAASQRELKQIVSTFNKMKFKMKIGYSCWK